MTWLQSWRRIAELLSTDELTRLRDVLAGDHDADRRLLLHEVSRVLGCRIELMSQIVGTLLGRPDAPTIDDRGAEDGQDIEPTDTDRF
jgi:hypothetical protein